MNSAPAIGIDLGTTFSLAAVYRDGKSEVIPNDEGRRLIPSQVFYHPKTTEVSIGSDHGMPHEQKPNVLFDLKRIIGRKYDDAYVQRLKNNQDYKFKLVAGDENKAEIELIHDGVKVCKSPEQACSEILRYIREYASDYLGAEVTEAVISVPAHFSNAQRKATRSAAELAGLNVLKLITEPVAGAIHYAKDRLKTQATLLVFDFGGGTLDVSIIEVNDNMFEVKSVEGELLGGRDIDQILMEHFSADMINTFGKQKVDRLLQRLKKNCVYLKKKLSTKQNISYPIEYVNENTDIEYTISMSRVEFEALSKNIFARCINLIDKCLNGAGLSKKDITDVVLVGGSTRIPKIREMICSYFGNKELRTDLNPDEAVALGAAIQAALLKKKFKELEKYKITEVTPLSIGEGMPDNLMDVIIKKNTRLPFKSKPIKSYTSENNQESCMIEIFEGERKNCKYNNLLGAFHIDNLPKGRAGQIEFDTIYSLDEDGILEVEAFETTTGKRNKLTINIEEFRLCEYKIKNALDDAAKNLKEDETFEIFVYYKWIVRGICNNILYDINKITSKTEKTFVEEKCIHFKEFIDNLEYTEIEVLREKYNNFREAVEPIVPEYDLNVKFISNEINSGEYLNVVHNFFENFQSNVENVMVSIPTVENSQNRRRFRRKRKENSS